MEIALVAHCVPLLKVVLQIKSTYLVQTLACLLVKNQIDNFVPLQLAPQDVCAMEALFYRETEVSQFAYRKKIVLHNLQDSPINQSSQKNQDNQLNLLKALNHNVQKTNTLSPMAQNAFAMNIAILKDLLVVFAKKDTLSEMVLASVGSSV